MICYYEDENGEVVPAKLLQIEYDRELNKMTFVLGRDMKAIHVEPNKVLFNTFVER